MRRTLPQSGHYGTVRDAAFAPVANNGYFATTQLDAKIDSYPNNGGDVHTVLVYPTDTSGGGATDAAFNLAVFCH